MSLVRYDCGDLCSPHAYCEEHRTLTCPCTIALLSHVDDVRAAILALPRSTAATRAAARVTLHVLTALPCETQTAEIVWRGTAWHRPMPVLVVEVGVVGQIPAWRVCCGRN